MLAVRPLFKIMKSLIRTIVYSYLILISLSAYPKNDLNKIYEVIRQVESRGDTLAVGDGGKALGVVQIHKIAIDDVNRIYGTDFKHSDAFSEKKSKKIFLLYIKAGIKRFRRLMGREPTEEVIVRFWNGGIYKGHLKKSTIKYYNKYLKIKNEKHNKIPGRV